MYSVNESDSSHTLSYSIFSLRILYLIEVYLKTNEFDIISNLNNIGLLLYAMVIYIGTGLALHRGLGGIGKYNRNHNVLCFARKLLIFYRKFVPVCLNAKE